MNKELRKQFIQDLGYAISFAKHHRKRMRLFIKNNGIDVYLRREKA